MQRDAIVVAPDRTTLAEEAARRVAGAARDAVSARGRFTLALSGGSTPRALHARLASLPEGAVPWGRTWILFGDERCVPADHPHSNYRMARETLLDRLPVAAAGVLRIEGEREPDDAARRYEEALRALFPKAPLPAIDLVVLGIGTDGHTASLFPGSPALEETRRWAVAAEGAGAAPHRVTLTLPVLEAARQALFLATGAGKAAAVAEAFGGRPHARPLPAERARPRDGIRTVIVDREAGALVTGDLLAGGRGA
jgi:6-phosphogluconolactonase